MSDLNKACVDNVSTYSLMNYLVYFLLTVLALSVPLLPGLPFSVDFIPAIDMPQHLAQLRMLADGVDGNVFSVAWFSPGSFVYIVAYPLWFLFGPDNADLYIMLSLLLMWCASLFFLAYIRKVHLVNVVLACAFFYNLIFYWGFINFLCGAPFYFVFLSQLINTERLSNLAVLFCISLFLFWSHPLWFAVACLSLGVYSLSVTRDFKRLAVRSIPLLPVGIYSLFWVCELKAIRASSGFDVSSHWFVSVFSRLNPSHWMNVLTAGSYGLAEFLIIAISVAWLVYSAIKCVRCKEGAYDRVLLWSALPVFLIVMIAPDLHLNTMVFAQRWLPIFVVLVLLATPAFSVPRWVNYGAVVVIFIYVLLMMFSWNGFNSELSGLSRALKSLPEKQRVLGLNYASRSRYIKGPAFLQIFAYSQAYKGAELNFSFAQHNSSIVRYIRPRKMEWTNALEWQPENVTQADIMHFDYILVNALNEKHERFLEIPYLLPCADSDRWRLYKVVSVSASLDRSSCEGG